MAELSQKRQAVYARQKYLRERGLLPPLPTKKCAICRKEFVPIRNRHGEARFCRDCSKEHGRVRCEQIINGNFEQTCKHCGKIFGGRKRKYCSKECKDLGRIRDKERDREKAIKWYSQNGKSYYQEYRNRDYVKERIRKYQIENRQNSILYKREKRRLAAVENGKSLRITNQGSHSAHVKEWVVYKQQIKKQHDGHVLAYKRVMKTKLIAKKQKEKYHADPKMAIYHRVKRWMQKHLIKRTPSKKWSEILGYTPEQLAHHLEKQFLRGMSWDNKGEWHIDHIVPVARFNVKEVGDHEFMACYALSNLRPLWGKENAKKNAKLLYLL